MFTKICKLRKNGKREWFLISVMVVAMVLLAGCSENITEGMEESDQLVFFDDSSGKDEKVSPQEKQNWTALKSNFKAQTQQCPSLGTRIYSNTFAVSRGKWIDLYMRKSGMREDACYIAVVTPTSGDPDLYIYGRAESGSWRRIRYSINAGSAEDRSFLKRDDLRSYEDRGYFSVYGWTDASFEIVIYRSVEEGERDLGLDLLFPIRGLSPDEAPVSALLDHDTRKNYIRIFTGETGSYWDGCLRYRNGQNVACGSSEEGGVRGFKRPGGRRWSTPGIDYRDFDPGSDVILWYDNHRGYDYLFGEGTTVRAAASGRVTQIISSYGQVEITHNNGMKTYYTHMRNIRVSVGDRVTTSTVLAEISDVAPSWDPVGVHLHFVVKDEDGNVLDPYGVKGSYRPMWD